MPTPAYTIVCTRKLLMAPGVYELAFTKPEALAFQAGQFVLFDVPLIDNPTDTQPRAYSIASTPQEKELLFVIKLKAEGRASEWIEKVVTDGTAVRIQGPFGLFTVKPDASLQYVFMATGAGIAPFRSQVKWLLEEELFAGRLDLIFSVRLTTDLFWTETFSTLAAAYPNFHFHLSLTDFDAAWRGLQGRVQTILPTVLIDAAKAHVYICGAPEMVQDVKNECITKFGLAKTKVHAEGYI